MTLAMAAGMVAGSLFGISSVSNTELRAGLWLVAITAPMVAWMRYRGHAWRASAEMSGAMIVPTVALLPCRWAGLISAATLIGLEHGLMVPAMLGLMVYRRREYGWDRRG